MHAQEIIVLFHAHDDNNTTTVKCTTYDPQLMIPTERKAVDISTLASTTLF